jgi:hypothetical protein
MEKFGDWQAKSKADYETGMTISLDSIPEVKKQYSSMLKKYIFPCAAKLFPTFKPTHHDEVYVLRYKAHVPGQKKMKAHYDGEPLACVLALNKEFKGGGTFYPVFDYVAKGPPGSILMYPGGLSHLHGGAKIHDGTRYVLLHAIYDRILFGDTVSPWEPGEPQHTK